MTEIENPFPGQVLAHADLEEQHYGSDIVTGVSIDKANLVSSLMEKQDELRVIHKPVLDIDFPVKVVPSSTEGHYHLFLDVEITWDAYVDLLAALATAGVVEEGWAEACMSHGHSVVRLPHVKKPAETGLLTEMAETAAILADPFAMAAIDEAQSEAAA